MFTGIIEGLGKLTGIRSVGSGRRLSVLSDFFLDDTRVGDSIAVNGACLTVVFIEGRRFEVDISSETVEKTTFSRILVGDRLNLERALRLTGRLDGHLVSGHIDGTGKISGIHKHGNAILISIDVPEALSLYMINKGSIAVDGISLTINQCHRDGFDVSIIPHTADSTTLALRKAGDPVNIETDMIGKYIERFTTRGKTTETAVKRDRSDIDKAFLAKNGFL